MSRFIIKDSPGKGKGLFITDRAEKDDILFKFDGTLFTNEPGKISANHLQIDKNLYLDMGNHVGVFVNHSCNPNCYIKIAIKSAFLIATRPITAGSELFYDYSLTSTELAETFSMECSCQPYGCRKLISGFKTVPETQRTKLISLGHVPSYVVKHL